MIAALPLSRERAEDALQFFARSSLFDKSKSLFPRQFEQFLVAQRIRDMKTQRAGLPGAKEFARPA